MGVSLTQLAGGRMTTTRGEKVFDAVLGGERGKEKGNLGNLLFFAMVAAGMVFLIYLVSMWWWGPAAAVGTLGQSGDFFGGILNPILSFLAFIGVLYSIHLQRNDLAENEKQTQRQFENAERQFANAERQRFETTFFQMLTVHDSIVSSIDIIKSPGQVVSTGRESFKKFVRDLSDSYDGLAGPQPDHNEARIQEAYRQFWKDARKDLGHYMRFLYNIIRYVDTATLPQLPGEDVDPKTKYTRILRSQISDYELIILFYNFFSEHAERFRPFYERYDLLDNMPREILLHPEHFALRKGMGSVDGESAI